MLTKRMDEMVRSIQDEIISGKRKVGDYLPSERELGKLYSLSNKSVRRCLEVLVGEGLIEKIPKVGNRISGVSDTNSITIRFGCQRSTIEEADLGNLITIFHKEYPHIRIQTIMFEHFTSAQEALENGLIDVVTVNYPNFRKILEHGSAHLLTPQKINPNIYTYLNKAFTHEDTLLVQPFMFSPVVLCYNRDHFREKELLEPDSSWTWEDLKRAAELLAIPNQRYGFYFPLLSSNRWPVFLLQSGEKLPPIDQPIRFADSPWMEGLRLCRDTVLTQSSMPIFYEEADAEKLFLQEKVSMIMTTYFGLNEFKKTQFEYDIAPLPYAKTPHTLLITIGLGLSSKFEQQEAAQTFIDYMVSHRSQMSLRQRTLSVPALKPAAEWIGSETMFRPSHYQMHRDIVPTYRFYTDLNVTMEMLSAIILEVKLYWAGLESEEGIANKLEGLLNEMRASRLVQ